MEIYVSGKPQPSWRRSDDRQVQLSQAALPLSGRLLSRDEATERLEAVSRRKMRIVVAAAILGTAGCLVALAAGTSGTVVAAIFSAAMFVGLNFAPETARQSRALQRIRANFWPTPGSELRLTDNEVHLDGEAIAWADLAASRLDVMSLPGDADVMEIDSLEALAGDQRVVFHRYAWEYGGALIDAAYVRLVRERGLAS